MTDSPTATSFQFVQTLDGSPSLRLAAPGGAPGELMHSHDGAFAETVYIYGTAMQEAFNRLTGASAKVLSVGLGLGYNELLATALFLKSTGATNSETFGGESFELVPELRTYFIAWLSGSPARDEVPLEFCAAYDRILQLVAEHTGGTAELVRQTLCNAVMDERWKISEALTSQTHLRTGFHVICFDAFSAKTSPDLWDEAFLRHFFATVAAPSCVVSTYACTGALKRALKQAKFTVEIRKGFANKRDSTFAARGDFISALSDASVRDSN